MNKFTIDIYPLKFLEFSYDKKVADYSGLPIILKDNYKIIGMNISSDNGNRGKGIVFKYILECIKKENSDIKSLISHITYGGKPNIIKLILEVNKDIYQEDINLFYYDDYLEIADVLINDKNAYTCSNYNDDWMVDSDYFSSNGKYKIEIIIKNNIYKLIS